MNGIFTYMTTWTSLETCVKNNHRYCSRIHFRSTCPLGPRGIAKHMKLFPSEHKPLLFFRPKPASGRWWPHHRERIIILINEFTKRGIFGTSSIICHETKVGLKWSGKELNHLSSQCVPAHPHSQISRKSSLMVSLLEILQDAEFGTWTHW